MVKFLESGINDLEALEKKPLVRGCLLGLNDLLPPCHFVFKFFLHVDFRWYLKKRYHINVHTEKSLKQGGMVAIPYVQVAFLLPRKPSLA